MSNMLHKYCVWNDNEDDIWGEFWLLSDAIACARKHNVDSVEGITVSPWNGKWEMEEGLGIIWTDEYVNI